MGKRGLLPAIAICALVAGCSGGNELHDVDAERLAQWEGAVRDEASPWPLTVDEAQVDCLGGDALAIRADGDAYWLNGLGKDLADQFDLQDPDPIWADDPDTDGLKIPMDALIDYGLSICN